MTTNQTIDGVPRDYVLRLTPEAHSTMLGMVEHCLNVRACMGMDEGFKDLDTEEEYDFVKELRALLDAPATERKPFGWWRVPPGLPLQGMFLPYVGPETEAPIQNALDSGFTVTRLYDHPESQADAGELERLNVAIGHAVRQYQDQAVLQRLEINDLRIQLSEANDLLKKMADIDLASADLDYEHWQYLLGEVSLQLATCEQTQAQSPDKALCDFYQVSDYPGLVRELVGHVAQLQDSAKRNVKPWEDTFPPTLLPAHIERVKAANAVLQPPSELAGEIVEFGSSLKEVSWKDGKMPEVGVRLYSAPPAAPVPGGWKLVPINPTPDMLKAVDDEASDKHLARGRAISAWGLMLDAAPLPSIRDLHYGVAHAVECQLPAQRLVGGHEIGGLHFPAPSQLATAGDGRALEPAEPILVEAVAVTRECNEDGLRLEWLLEGGIAALEHSGTVLLVAHGTVTNDHGHGYVIPAEGGSDE